MRTKIHPARFHAYCNNLLKEIDQEKQELIEIAINHLLKKKFLFIFPTRMTREKALKIILEDSGWDYLHIRRYKWRIKQVCEKIIIMVKNGYGDIEVELTDDEMEMIGITREKV